MIRPSIPESDSDESGKNELFSGPTTAESSNTPFDLAGRGGIMRRTLAMLTLRFLASRRMSLRHPEQLRPRQPGY